MQRLDHDLEKHPGLYRKMLLDCKFQEGYVPDYSDASTAYFYLGHLGPSYALEYYLLYRIALGMLASHGSTDVHVYAFGCGSMIDAWSLSWAGDSLPTSMPLAYTGIDLSPWPAQFDAPVSQEFRLEPMEAVWDRGGVFDGNLLLFPKVLSELREDGDSLARFCAGIERANFAHDTIALCVSYRSKATFMRDWRLPDWCKAQEIVSALENKGYACVTPDLGPHETLGGILHQDEAVAESGTSYPYYYLRAAYGDLSIADIAPDFMPDSRLSGFLTHPSSIRYRCPHLARRIEQYLEQNPHASLESLCPMDACTACCPIRCNTGSRTLLRRGSDICFQVLLFQRKPTACPSDETQGAREGGRETPQGPQRTEEGQREGGSDPIHKS